MCGVARHVGAKAERAEVVAPKIRTPSAHPTLVPRDRLVSQLHRLDTDVSGRRGHLRGRGGAGTGDAGHPGDADRADTIAGAAGGVGVDLPGGADSAELGPAEHPSPQVALVCAPAGSGKTTLVSAWAEQVQARQHGPNQVAWVSLDSDDNDLYLLWSTILAALEATGAWGDGSTLRRLSPPRTAMEPGFYAAFVAAVDQASAPVWLVLDDVHELTDSTTLQSLDMLVRRTPRQLRLVLSTRATPPVAIHRLRMEGRLTVIDAAQLTFTRDEVALLLAGHDLTLADRDLNLVLSRTEGWAAGVRLAALSLADGTDATELLSDFTGDDTAVADYLVAEIVSRQPDHVQEFLLATSVCERVSIDLASLLSGRNDAGEILDELVRTNALIVRLRGPGQWYRYHSLLRGYLRAQLHRRHASMPAALHRAAAVWFSRQGAAQSALEHAAAAGDLDLTTQLLEQHGLSLLLNGGGVALRRLLADLPPEVLARPGVGLVAAEAALDVGDVPTADARLALMRIAVEEQATDRLRALHAAVALHRARLHGDVPTALDTLSAVHSGASGCTGDTDVEMLAMLNRGVSHIWLADPDAAETELQRALALARGSGRDSVALQCLSNLGGVSASNSELVEMSARAEEALDFAASRGWARTSHCGYAYVLAGWGAYQRLDETAHRYAPLAVEVLQGQTDTTVELGALSLAAIVEFDTAANRHGVVAALREAWRRLGGELMAPALIAYAAPYEQRMALRVGEVTWADEVSRRAQLLLGQYGEPQLLRAVVFAHKGQNDAARKQLQPVLMEKVRCVTRTTLLDAWLLEAKLADQANDQHRAHEALLAALALAEPRMALRALVDGGPQVRELLVREAGRFGQHEEFARRALNAMPTESDSPVPTLTRREREILAELPSMHTIEQIAESLCVSPNTVKTHLRGVYRKLNARNRREAVSAAIRLNLLNPI